ncbi:MAG: ABC transporter permease, partial [Coriobacteriales bacterium]|nr:ABC transporter permease [Coriobacteriales bacterium]
MKTEPPGVAAVVGPIEEPILHPTSGTTPAALSPRGDKRVDRSVAAPLAPYSIWALIFIVVPLGFVAYYAFTDVDFHFTLDNIVKFFTATSQVVDADGSMREVHTYLRIFYVSLKLAVISTVICLLMGYPIAYIMSRASARTQRILVSLVMIPMWMNFLIRTYAWMTILQDTGIINELLGTVGLGSVHIIGTQGAVVIGMVYDYLPYMILPIYSIMAKLDPKLIEAARDLGCNAWSTLKRVILPLSLPGIVSGIMMVLVPSVSTFYISQKLGNGMFYLMGDAIEAQYVANNLHFAAAIALIVMVVLVAIRIAV